MCKLFPSPTPLSFKPSRVTLSPRSAPGACFGNVGLLVHFLAPAVRHYVPFSHGSGGVWSKGGRKGEPGYLSLRSSWVSQTKAGRSWLCLSSLTLGLGCSVPSRDWHWEIVAVHQVSPPQTALGYSESLLLLRLPRTTSLQPSSWRVLGACAHVRPLVT